MDSLLLIIRVSESVETVMLFVMHDVDGTSKDDSIRSRTKLGVWEHLKFLTLPTRLQLVHQINAPKNEGMKTFKSDIDY